MIPINNLISYAAVLFILGILFGVIGVSYSGHGFKGGTAPCQIDSSNGHLECGR